jgi:hypothetical protein
MSAVVRVLRAVVRVGRRLVWLALFVVGVQVMAAVVGVWPTATIVAAGLVIDGLAAWADHIEPRLFAPRFPELGPEFVVRLDPPGVEVDHVAFAQALSAVADAYLQECRRQAGVVDEDGFL